MTNPETSDTPAPDPSLLVVESFIDGEAIDLEALKDALARPEGREHLVDLLALRDAVWATAPRACFVGEGNRTPFERGVRRFAIAAGLILSITTGYLAGQGAAERPLDSSGVEAVVDMMDVNVAAPPQPTHVIPLRPGVNWTETSGGR
jgi:hypothetical protein